MLLIALDGSAFDGHKSSGYLTNVETALELRAGTTKNTDLVQPPILELNGN